MVLSAWNIFGYLRLEQPCWSNLTPQISDTDISSMSSISKNLHSDWQDHIHMLNAFHMAPLSLEDFIELNLNCHVHSWIYNGSQASKEFALQVSTTIGKLLSWGRVEITDQSLSQNLCYRSAYLSTCRDSDDSAFIAMSQHTVRPYSWHIRRALSVSIICWISASLITATWVRQMGSDQFHIVNNRWVNRKIYNFLEVHPPAEATNGSRQKIGWVSLQQNHRFKVCLSPLFRRSTSHEFNQFHSPFYWRSKEIPQGVRTSYPDSRLRAWYSIIRCKSRPDTHQFVVIIPWTDAVSQNNTACWDGSLSCRNWKKL